jgi:1-phosphatidylinositol phosphodiesterase
MYDMMMITMITQMLTLTGLLTLVSATSTPVPLADLALQKVLNDAAPIFGRYTKSTLNTSVWMKSIPDDTPIVRMNIPGTHDSATWNYSLATQEALDGITTLNGESQLPPEFFRCQDKSLVSMLNAGIRAFDLRYAFDATNSTIVFYHSGALLSETATLTDVLFGFYKWLDDHPSEVLFVSLQYEGGTKVYASDNAAMQQALFDVLTAPHARQYLLQSPVNAFGTLGPARGKIILLRRFDLDNLPATAAAQLPGVHFSPASWTDNSPDITLVYNATTNATAYIEDYYQPLTPFGSSAQENIQWKYNATTAHLLRAAAVSGEDGAEPDSLFWTFASSENDVNIPFDFPQIMATGNGTQSTPQGGVNQMLVPFLKTLKGQRVGIVMFDFYETPGQLVNTLLSL